MHVVTRLPHDPIGASIVRGQQRMVPGGRLWSESPVRRLLYGQSTGSAVAEEPSSECVIYSPIYMPDPTSVSVDDNYYITPRATGLPVIEGVATEDLQGGFLRDNTGYGASLGAPVASGSSHSYDVAGEGGVSVAFDVRGKEIYPQTDSATYFKASTWVYPNGFSKPSVSQYAFQWYIHIAWDTTKSMSFGLTYGRPASDAPWSWSFDDSNNQTFAVPVPAFSSLDPYDMAAQFLTFYYDVSTNTITFTVRGTSWSYSDYVQPTGPFDPVLTSPGKLFFRVGVSYRYYDVGSVRVDGMRFETDAPWCPYP